MKNFKSKNDAIFWANQNIPRGHDNPITRSDLMLKVGLNDRKIREMIGECKRYVPIVNVQDGKGYYIPNANDPVDVLAARQCYHQEVKRFKAIAYGTKGLKEFCKCL